MAVKISGPFTGLPNSPFKSPHSSRPHAGVERHPKIVQERLGHSLIAITMDIYSHLMPNMQVRQRRLTACCGRP